MAFLLEVVFGTGGNRRRIKIATILPPDANCNKSTLNLQRTAGQGRVPGAAGSGALQTRDRYRLWRSRISGAIARRKTRVNALMAPLRCALRRVRET